MRTPSKPTPPGPSPVRARRQRRALSHIGGTVEVSAGDAVIAEALRSALDVQPREELVQAHVHGFHSYPARLHPETAGRLIDKLSRARDAVLDPFCGSGTVVVVARELGRRAIGSDLNPLAVELTRLKASGASPEFIASLRRAADGVMEHARGRKEAEAGPSERYGPEDRALFAPHVLLELDGLRHGIERLAEREVARTLAMVHSALLTKLSRREGDSSQAETSKRISGGFAIRFFGMKVDELSRRLTEFSEKVPPGTPRPRVQLSDARDLAYLEDAAVSLVVSSPPYPGVYDYFEHHRTRIRWLRLDGARLERGEIGARRSAEQGASGANRRWQRDFTQCLGELRRVLKPGGRAALVVADSVLAGRPLHADRWLPELARDAGLALAGHAAQERPYFHQPTGKAFARLPRREHLFVLEKTA